MTRSTRWMWSAAAAAGLALGYAAAVPHVGATARAEDDPKGSHAAAAATFEVYKDKANEFRWRLRAANRRVIATSGEGYKERRDCVAGIESVKRHAADAKVEDEPASP